MRQLCYVVTAIYDWGAGRNKWKIRPSPVRSRPIAEFFWRKSQDTGHTRKEVCVLKLVIRCSLSAVSIRVNVTRCYNNKQAAGRARASTGWPQVGSLPIFGPAEHKNVAQLAFFGRAPADFFFFLHTFIVFVCFFSFLFFLSSERCLVSRQSCRRSGP